jgi:hypothetical protein
MEAGCARYCEVQGRRVLMNNRRPPQLAASFIFFSLGQALGDGLPGTGAFR